jgi:ribonuclease VapC
VSESTILDGSAILAYLNDEPGAERVANAMGAAVASAVNISEVAAKFAEKGVPPDRIDMILSLVPDIRPLTRERALAAAALRPATRHLGLSLGDRACIALAIEPGGVALTADKAWADINPAILGPASIALVR